MVELQLYVELEDLTHMVIKAKRQLQRKGKRDVGSYSSTWKQNVSKRDKKPSYKPKAENSKPRGEKSNCGKSSSKPEPTKRNGKIKCFKSLGRGHKASPYLNKKTMLLREDIEY